MSPDTIETSVGTMPVLHRLALGVLLRDAVDDSTARGRLRVGWEATGRLLPHRSSADWPCIDLEPVGGARFRLRATPRRPQQLTLRIDDPSRRYVPRRLGVTLWSNAELSDPVPANAIATASRTVPVWLFPGAAYPLPRGSTAIRGRVVRQGRAVPWARVRALGTTGATLGTSHGDDRGEFLLHITDLAQNPVQSTVGARLLVRGPVGTPALPPVETAIRPANPPGPGDLDNALLRGAAPPVGHLPSTLPPPLFTVDVGQEQVVGDIPFDL
ncbi:hypothetical protein [Agrococcus sp. DT81.2]|uniref:hypothetical protein n=1 Tax=Agrococcus sp. DT81.2 TaxID=3393414 RepID=UPI003CE4AA15